MTNKAEHKPVSRNLNRYKIKDMHDHFCRLHPDLDYSVTQYRKVLEDANLFIRDRIVDHGDVLNMGRLSRLFIMRVPRNHQRKMVNWKETMKLDCNERGNIKKFIYFTDDYFFKLHWQKRKCMVKNRKNYAFTPTKNVGGFKRQYTFKFKLDPLIHSLYLTTDEVHQTDLRLKEELRIKKLRNGNKSD